MIIKIHILFKFCFKLVSRKDVFVCVCVFEYLDREIVSRISKASQVLGRLQTRASTTTKSHLPQSSKSAMHCSHISPLWATVRPVHKSCVCVSSNTIRDRHRIKIMITYINNVLNDTLSTDYLHLQTKQSCNHSHTQENRL